MRAKTPWPVVSGIPGTLDQAEDRADVSLSPQAAARAQMARSTPGTRLQSSRRGIFSLGVLSCTLVVGLKWLMAVLNAKGF